MNLDELRTVQSKERRKDSLQHLRDSFYGDVADYIAELKAERTTAAEEADDPFSSPEVSRLTDEIETAEEVVEAIYERRVGKVVKLASFAAADMPVDEDGMTTEEQALFDDLVARIGTNKRNVLDILAGKRRPGDVETDSQPASEPSDATATTRESTSATEVEEAGAVSESTADSAGVLADAMGTGGDDPTGDVSETAVAGQPEPSDGGDGAGGRTPVEPEDAPPGAVSTTDAESESPTTESETGSSSSDTTEAGATGAAETTGDSGADTERTTVRITKDVGAIFGVDEREYDLAKEDVVSLPTTNAEPLVEREAAERLD